MFYQGQPLPEVDRPSFQLLDEFYVKDKHSVYLVDESGLRALCAEPATFRPLGFGFACHSARGYWQDLLLEVEPGSLVPVGFGVALDSQGVVWESRRILMRPLNHRTTRIALGETHLFVWDDSGVWFSREHGPATALEPVEPMNFRVLEGQQATDGQRRFLGAQLQS